MISTLKLKELKEIAFFEGFDVSNYYESVQDEETYQFIIDCLKHQVDLNFFVHERNLIVAPEIRQLILKSFEHNVNPSIFLKEGYSQTKMELLYQCLKDAQDVSLYIQHNFTEDEIVLHQRGLKLIKNQQKVDEIMLSNNYLNKKREMLNDLYKEKALN